MNSAAPVLTLVVGAVLLVAGIHHTDPAGTISGTILYMLGLHWTPVRVPGSRSRRKKNRPGSGRPPGG